MFLSEMQRNCGLESNREAAIQQYGHISDWNTSQVTDMSCLFKVRKDFNENISQWDVSNVKDMEDMFCCAFSFKTNLWPHGM